MERMSVPKTMKEECPLHEASLNEHEAVISLLLKKGTNVNAKSNSGKTSPHLAAHNGHEALVSCLLEENGTNVNASTDRVP
jgi:ankyrin repeat protein